VIGKPQPYAVGAGANGFGEDYSRKEIFPREEAMQQEWLSFWPK
jgi:hypothetical protein